jgi:two-component system alkaline phosphatase synthesis response regulator PhoP
MDKSHTRILLVEDDLVLSKLYKARLTNEGMDVRTATDGEQALSQLKQFLPKLMIVDIMMPKVNGFDVIDIARSTPETKDTRIIVLSAMSQPADMERAKALGADEYLVKSQVMMDDVIATVHRLLGMPAPQTNPQG